MSIPIIGQDPTPQGKRSLELCTHCKEKKNLVFTWQYDSKKDGIVKMSLCLPCLGGLATSLVEANMMLLSMNQFLQNNNRSFRTKLIELAPDLDLNNLPSNVDGTNE